MPLTVIKRLLLVTALVLSLPAGAAPMDDVFTLLDAGGGVRSGRGSETGYYIAALGLSDRSSEAKAYEEARLKALRYLNEMVNGVTISGNTYTSSEYLSESSEGSTSEYSLEAFRDVVELEFKGHLSAAKTFRQGKYDGKYFTAIAITQNDVRELQGLKSGSSPGSGSTTVVIATDSQSTVASFGNESRSVETKGLASMKNGEQKARELALQDAMRNAVQQVQGVMLQGRSGAFNEALSFALSTRTEGYVEGYEIIDEDIARGNFYVIIMARVNAGQLLSDVNFYLDILGKPVFSVESTNTARTDWLVNELERLGFTIHDGQTRATHTFYLDQSQRQVKNHNGKVGMETFLAVKLKDNASGEVLFTILNDPLKSRIYVSPLDRARQVSQVSAYRKLTKQLGGEVIQSLARYAERGRVYSIEIRNARRTDWQLFKHTLDNGTGGTVEGWNWSRDGKVMILDYRYAGKLSSAMDEGLEQIYQTYRKEGSGRRSTAIRITDSRAVFEIINR